jgi:hypothetical protein
MRFPSLTRSRSTWEPWDNLDSATKRLWTEKEKQIKKNLLEKFNVETFYVEEDKVNKTKARRLARLARKEEAPVKVKREESEDEAGKRKRDARERLRARGLQQVEDGITGPGSVTLPGATPNEKRVTDSAKTSSRERQSAEAMRQVDHDINGHEPVAFAGKMLKKKRAVDSEKTSARERSRAQTPHQVKHDINGRGSVIPDGETPKRQNTRDSGKSSSCERQAVDQVERRVRDSRSVELVVRAPKKQNTLDSDKTSFRDRPQAQATQQVERDVNTLGSAKQACRTPKKKNALDTDKTASRQAPGSSPVEETPSVDGKVPPLKKRKLSTHQEPASRVEMGDVVSKRPAKTSSPSRKQITEQELAKIKISRESDTSLEASLTRRPKIATTQSPPKPPDLAMKRRLVSLPVQTNTNMRLSNGSNQKPRPASRGAKGSQVIPILLQFPNNDRPDRIQGKTDCKKEGPRRSAAVQSHFSTVLHQ